MQFLYLVQCQQFYKIGIASDVQSRLAQLATGNPFDLKLLAVYGFENATPVELALHQRFANKRIKREWFNLSVDDLKALDFACVVLGGIANKVPTTPNEEEVEEADELLALPTDGAKFDFVAMFSDGWRMERATSKKVRDRYWAWRRGGEDGQRECIYGGVIANLPYPDLEEMRRRYAGKGE